MSGELRNFDPDKVTASFVIREGAGGTIDLTIGLVDAAGAISDSKDAPRWTRRGDRQGNYVRIKSSKRGGFLTFMYTAESASHDALSTVYALDDLTGTEVGEIVVKDLNGTTLATYVGVGIENDPDVNYGDTAADRAWVFGYARRDQFVGGATVL